MNQPIAETFFQTEEEEGDYESSPGERSDTLVVRQPLSAPDKARWADMQDRHGKFVIGLHLIEEQPEIVSRLMAEVIVTRAECMWHSRSIEYTAISPRFRKIPRGETMPSYSIMTELKGGEWDGFGFHEDGPRAQL